MATEIFMPKQGQSVEACSIVSWRKQPGERVAVGEVVCEIETDKATFEVESPTDGVLLTQLVAEGVEVPVLTPIAAVGEGEEELPAADIPLSAEVPPPSEQEVVSVGQTRVGSTAIAQAGSGHGRLPISPRARRAARQMQVDVAAITGTGPRGRIVERDVVATGALGAATQMTAAHPATPQAATIPSAGERTPIRGVRKLIAERMHASLRDTAQLTLNGAADAETMLALRAALKKKAVSAVPDTPQALLGGITLNDLVMYAVSRTLPAFPDLNAIIGSTAGEGEWMERFDDVHLGFAVDTDVGLMVPVVHDAHVLSLLELSQRANSLAAAARSRSIAPDQLQGGTFTVSNLGVFGIESFTPVLNTPQVAILGVGAVVVKPLLDEEEVTYRRQLGLSLTIDHRVVDGAPAARFLQALAESIADIDLLLAT